MSRSVFDDLTATHLAIHKKRIERIVSEIKAKAPSSLVETVLVGMELIEKEPVNDKKGLLFDCLDDEFDAQLVDDIVEAVVAASKGRLDINRPVKKGCFTGRP
jgi:uncharacterized protein YdhG (YjbR/CyaY superfamily)